MRRATAIYRALLRAYPGPFREEYGRQMSLMFAEQLADARRAGARRSEATLWAQAARDLATIAPREHWHVILQDLRYAVRTMALKPAFTAVAILSLALGIGANTAIFSLWNGVLHAALPGVENPDRLVMLTDPAASGMWRGRWTGATDGPRAWVSYAEFEQLRDHAPGFSSMMASQSSLETWPVGVDGGALEDARGRLVSGRFFDVLGARPAIGRLFTAAEDGGEPAIAVISHAFWRRRFDGRLDALGRTLRVRDVSLTIVGVTRAGFVGETSGQQPDVWLPLRLQPRLLPGADWLHEQAPDKVMWLHLFARLHPGVTAAQAEARANGVFRAGLASFYGESAGDRRAEFLDQQLRVRPGARGASASRDELSSSLTMLLASVGVLLLIACANLANLLLARGAARETEIAVRLSLGATRPRLIRQLVTESLALAAAGGVAAIAVAYFTHGALVRLLQDAEPRFFMGFGFTMPVLLFVVAATVVAAVVFGALPAWQVTRTDPGARLKSNSRGAIGSRRELRSGRWLVGVQLALSLPLLVGAGLLVRTVHNLQHPDLGLQSERMLMARLNLGQLVRDVPRRNNVLRELQDRLRRIPGVEDATFSHLGLFSGGSSTAGVVVDGGAARPTDSTLDRVGAGYFTTLRIPIRHGRDFADGDRADARKVCIVNDAFVQRHFGGRNPIGLRVVTVDDTGLRTPYDVIGVAGNARTDGLRGDVEPRFFLPAEQRPSMGANRVFLIRTAAEPAAVSGAVREVMAGIDGAVSVSAIAPVETHMERLTARERTIAQLAMVFGSVALMLASIGLYGVLSYGISTRSREIAIRIALGAQSRGIVGMILRETAWLVAAGLIAGGALTFYGSRLIGGLLYDVAPEDPLTVTLATSVLLVVALVAAYLPARRASRLHPMPALHAG
jgi:predicted permease